MENNFEQFKYYKGENECPFSNNTDTEKVRWWNFEKHYFDNYKNDNQWEGFMDFFTDWTIRKAAAENNGYDLTKGNPWKESYYKNAPDNTPDNIRFELLYKPINKFKAEFEEISTIQNMSKEQVEIDILEWSIKKNVEYRDTIIDPYKKEDAKRMIDGQYKNLQRLNDIQHIERLKDLKQSEPEKNAVSSPQICFKCDSEMIARVYEFLIDDNVLDCTAGEFMNAIEKANFKSIKPLHKGKTKIKSLVYILSTDGKLGDVWYTNVTKSAGFIKDNCSGANVSDGWKTELCLAIKPKKPKNPHKY